MLMLLFSVGNGRYAFAAKQVLEISPWIQLERVALAPTYVAGLFNYRGEQIPVIDLCSLIEGTPCSTAYTSRIILARYAPEGLPGRVLGLLAEQVTEAVEIDAAAFGATGIEIEDAPFLGDAALTDYGLVQRITVEDLLPERVRNQLFQAEAV